MKDVAVVGLPASGKSTVFKAVTHAHASAGGGGRAHVAVVPVPDPRVEELARIGGSARAVHAQIRLQDVPGFTAHSLGEARAADALAVVLRAFGPDPDPAGDLQAFRAELALADLQTVERALERARRQRAPERGVLERAEAALSAGRWLAEEAWEPEERRHLALLTPLTLKPSLVVLNLDETGSPEDHPLPAPSLAIRGLLEAEAAELEEADAAALLVEFGVTEPASERFVAGVYRLLDLVTFLTFNDKEARAWSVRRGATAPEAAGAVHTDLQRGFIRAEVVAFEDLRAAGSWEAARERGLLQVHGKTYVVREGDVILFRHSA